jgi:hypothetical protein
VTNRPTDNPPRTETPQNRSPSEPSLSAPPASPVVASPSASAAGRADDHHLLTQDSFRAILSSHERAGRWEAADEIEVRAVGGEVTLDFTHADLPPSGVVEIDVWAIGGHVRIIVPDGAEIELEGTPILGSIEQKVRRKGLGAGLRDGLRELVTGEQDRDLPTPPASAEPPLFRIDAHAVCGVVEVSGR